MCDEPTTPLKRFAATLTSGTASGAVKASPGVAVTGLTVYGFPVETWVSVLTCLYLFFMIVGCLPKTIDTDPVSLQTGASKAKPDRCPGLEAR